MPALFTPDVAVAHANSRDFSWAIPDWQDRALPAKTLYMVLLQLVIVAQFRPAFDQGRARAWLGANVDEVPAGVSGMHRKGELPATISAMGDSTPSEKITSLPPNR